MEHGANTTEVVGSIFVWVVFLKVGLDGPCESFSTEKYSMHLFFLLFDPPYKDRAMSCTAGCALRNLLLPECYLYM